MYVECLETLAEFLSPSYLPLYEKALKRMQRYGYILERFISPEGYFPYIILSSDGTQERKCRPQLWNPLYTREEVINHYRKAVTHYEYLLPKLLRHIPPEEQVSSTLPPMILENWSMLRACLSLTSARLIFFIFFIFDHFNNLRL